MSLLFSVVRSVPFSNKPIAKDVIASLHSYFTCNILIIFAVILSFKHFGGRPIECLLPSGFSGAWEQYAENFCWAENTYFVSPGIFVEQVSVSDRRERRINYYQWMPFFLLFQAACFNASTLIWKYFAGHSGIKMGEILRLACDPLNANLTVKKMNINALNIHLQGALRFQERLKKRKLVPHKIFRFLNLRYSSFYISVVYMTAKCAFLFNACFQLHLLSSYLLSNIRYDFGLNAWCNLLFPSGNESSWNTTGVFPRVALCDFEVREMGNTHTHTVQCVLVVNIFTEKIFILLWTWFVILAIVTVMSIINWAYLLLSSCSKEHFILNHLEMGETKLDKENCETQKSVKKFLNKYLGIDGILVLRMIAAHADIVFSTELIVSLWQSHCHFESFRKTMKKINEVWPQHQRQLNLALMEEADFAEKYVANTFSDPLERKRSFFHGSVIDEKKSSLQSTSRKTSIRKRVNISRRHSFDGVGVFSVDLIEKFADSSEDEE